MKEGGLCWLMILEVHTLGLAGPQWFVHLQGTEDGIGGVHTEQGSHGNQEAESDWAQPSGF